MAPPLQQTAMNAAIEAMQREGEGEETGYVGVAKM
jgi:hypothetical protein